MGTAVPWCVPVPVTSIHVYTLMPLWLAGLMLETALGADLERFGNAQLQLLRLMPAQGSLLPDGHTDSNAKPAAAKPAAAPTAASPPAPVTPLAASNAAGSNAASAPAESGTSDGAVTSPPEGGAAGIKPSFAAHNLLH